jgi:hypothetical protein
MIRLTPRSGPLQAPCYASGVSHKRPASIFGMVLALVFSTGMGLYASRADACPRCNREGFQTSIIEGAFEHFHPITRTLRVTVQSSEGSYEERILVPGTVRPRRGDEILRWSQIDRGTTVEVEVEESGLERSVTAVRLL